jgi:hypothetical protein
MTTPDEATTSTTPTPEDEDGPIEELIDAACDVLNAASRFNVAARVACGPDGWAPQEVLAHLTEEGFADGPFGELFALMTIGCGEIAIAPARYKGEGFVRDAR